MTVLNVIRRPVKVIVQGRGLMGFKGDKGDPGTPAPELDIQYSADNSSWSDSYTAGDFYARFSTDSGSTWESALLIRGEQGIQGDEGPIGDTGPQGPVGTPAPALEIEYSADDVSWSTTYTAGDYYARFSVDGGSTWGAGLLFRGPQGDPGNLTGPASSVNENIPIFDGVTGDKLKDSGVKLSDKADVDDVALKADITALETEKKLLMDEIDSLKRSAIENSNSPYLTVSDYGDVILAKNSVGVGTVGVDGVTLTNLSPKTDGSVPWYIYNGLGTVSYDEESVIYTSSAVNNPIMTIYRSRTIIASNKYLVSFEVFTDVTSATGYIYDGTSVVSTVTVGSWNKIYGVLIGKTSAIFGLKSVTGNDIGKIMKIRNVIITNLTAHGLDSLTASQGGALVAGGYFDSKKTFGGIGCLVSKDSAEVEVGRMYFETTPMYSNATLKDVLAYDGGKYYHTHNVDSDGVAIAEPYDTEVETNGQIVCLSEGTVEYQAYFPDIAVYTDKFTLTKAITAVKELYKYGSETPIIDSVIAEDGLSFTSASLTAGDLTYGVFEFDEPLRPLMTIKSRNDDATVVDTVTGTVYTFRPVVTSGTIASWALTEV